MSRLGLIGTRRAWEGRLSPLGGLLSEYTSFFDVVEVVSLPVVSLSLVAFCHLNSARRFLASHFCSSLSVISLPLLPFLPLANLAEAS